MKKLLALILALSCLLGLTACGENPETPPEPIATPVSDETTLETPPELRIAADDGSVKASKGTYSWQYRLTGDLMQGIEADSLHPLQFNHLETLTTGSGTVKLEFDVPPDSVTAEECWSDQHWGNTSADDESFTLTGNELTLKPGGYIYTICVKWDQDNYSGTCRYVFHIVHDK